jgi:hypothetical protein
MLSLQASGTFYGMYCMIWRANQLRCGVLHAIRPACLFQTLQIDWPPRPSLVLSRSAGIGPNTYSRRTRNMWASTCQGRTASTSILWKSVGHKPTNQQTTIAAAMALVAEVQKPRRQMSPPFNYIASRRRNLRRHDEGHDRSRGTQRETQGNNL